MVAHLLRKGMDKTFFEPPIVILIPLEVMILCTSDDEESQWSPTY